LAVVATLSKGYDLDYIWKHVDRRPAKDAAVIGCYLIAVPQPGRSRTDHRTTPQDDHPTRQSLP
jgi:hypothetical protein